MAGEPYSYGVWITRPGCEEEFVAGWREFAEWTVTNAPGSRRGQLLQDTEQPTRFISLGPWETSEAIAAWRNLPGFKERIGRLRELLEGFTPATLELRVEAGAAEGRRAA